MATSVLTDKRTKLFLILGGFFIANAIVAEVIGVKIFSLEKTFGLHPFDLNILGNKFSFNLTAGVLLWPVVFIMTDIINEYFGMKGVSFLSFMAVVHFKGGDTVGQRQQLVTEADAKQRLVFF